MNHSGVFNVTRVRAIVIAAAGIFHLILIFVVTFRMNTGYTEIPQEQPAGVMKLMDVQEDTPPPPAPLPPAEFIAEAPVTNTLDSIAEYMIESEVITPPVIGAPGGPPSAYGQGTIGTLEQIEYLPQHRISVLPVLPEEEIRRRTVYPPIAQRSGIEGMVYLELFIDRQGNIREIRILRETPANHGFGEAAINAFRGISGKPAEANNVPVAVRYRYNISFALR